MLAATKGDQVALRERLKALQAELEAERAKASGAAAELAARQIDTVCL